MIRALLQFLRVQCGHSRTGFPITLDGRTYIVCSECGCQIGYSWSEMRVVGQ